MKSYNTRKNITLVSLSLAAIFAFALANADDYSTKSSDTSTSQSVTKDSADSMNQQAGKTSDSMSSDPSVSKPMANAPSTCTDANGVLYKKGAKGFDHCLQEKPSTGSIDQQGGTAGMGADKGSVDSNTASGTSAPGSSDSTIREKSSSSSSTSTSE